MLCANSYKVDYIDECRLRIKSLLAAYKALKSSADGKAADSFEPLFFNQLIVALDSCFAHRSRGIELKDGNPLNEVRMLCSSILQNHGVLAADKTIKYNPASSILKRQMGDKIKLAEADFNRLSDGFFAEIKSKFGQ